MQLSCVCIPPPYYTKHKVSFVYLSSYVYSTFWLLCKLSCCCSFQKYTNYFCTSFHVLMHWCGNKWYPAPTMMDCNKATLRSQYFSPMWITIMKLISITIISNMLWCMLYKTIFKILLNNPELLACNCNYSKYSNKILNLAYPIKV